MLARIKLDLPAIRQAILELDDDKLSADDLKAIGKQLPSSEEVGVCICPHLLFVVLTYPHRSQGSRTSTTSPSCPKQINSSIRYRQLSYSSFE